MCLCPTQEKTGSRHGRGWNPCRAACGPCILSPLSPDSLAKPSLRGFGRAAAACRESGPVETAVLTVKAWHTKHKTALPVQHRACRVARLYSLPVQHTLHRQPVRQTFLPLCHASPFSSRSDFGGPSLSLFARSHPQPSSLSRASGSVFSWPDLVFVLAAALFSLAATQGTLLLSPMGCGIDTDLQNYAQILEVARHPQAFAADPLARLFHLDPGVPNLQTVLAGLFPDSANAATALLKAGGLALFCQLVAWYVFGRLVFRAPSLSILLSMAASITYFWCFGTYWGATYEEPVPRIFYNALWPLLLVLACTALEDKAARLTLALVTGLSIFVHSVSALMTGGIFLCILLFSPLPEQRKDLVRHLTTYVVCLILFCLPVLLFFVLRVPLQSPDPASMDLLQQMFDMRFMRDWSTIWSSLGHRLLQYTGAVPLLPAGLFCLIIASWNRQRLPERAARLTRLLPLMAVGMVCVCLVCAAEMTLASSVGRLPMSNEILRGTRFIVPMSLVSITLFIALFWHILPRLLAGCLVVAGATALLAFSHDRQIVAAKDYAATLLGLPRSGEALALQAKCQLEYEALQAVQAHAAPDELVFAPEDSLGVRYVARRALLPVHKDGSLLYHCREVTLGAQWLARQQALRSGSKTIFQVWLESPAPWMLVRTQVLDAAGLSARNPTVGCLPVHLVYANADWQLWQKRDAVTPATPGIPGVPGVYGAVVPALPQAPAPAVPPAVPGMPPALTNPALPTVPGAGSGF